MTRPTKKQRKPSAFHLAYEDARKSGFSHREALIEAKYKPQRAATKRRVHISAPLPDASYFASLTEAPEDIALYDGTPEDAEPLNLSRVPGHMQTSRFLAWVAWYHEAYAARMSDLAASHRRAIHAHNQDVINIASQIDLRAKVDDNGIAAFDWADMLKRIETAAAQHKNRNTTRGRAKNANRHLAFRCPACSVYNEKRGSWSNTVRASAPDRVIMCAGRYGAEHTPTLCEFIEESQPDYRLQDDAAGTAINPEATPTDTYTEAALAHGAHSRSKAKIAANKTKYALQVGGITMASGDLDTALARLAAKTEALTTQQSAAGNMDDKSEFGF